MTEPAALRLPLLGSWEHACLRSDREVDLATVVKSEWPKSCELEAQLEPHSRQGQQLRSESRGPRTLGITVRFR